MKKENLQSAEEFAKVFKDYEDFIANDARNVLMKTMEENNISVEDLYVHGGMLSMKYINAVLEDREPITWGKWPLILMALNSCAREREM